MQWFRPKLEKIGKRSHNLCGQKYDVCRRPSATTSSNSSFRHNMVTKTMGIFVWNQTTYPFLEGRETLAISSDQHQLKVCFTSMNIVSLPNYDHNWNVKINPEWSAETDRFGTSESCFMFKSGQNDCSAIFCVLRWLVGIKLSCCLSQLGSRSQVAEREKEHIQPVWAYW